MHQKNNNMFQYIKNLLVLFILIWMASCDDSSDLLNQYLKDGPTIYAAKVDTMDLYSGLYRFKVNIYPANDVNRSYCILKWTLAGENDSVKVNYTEENFDNQKKCYTAIIDIPLDNMLGNMLIESYNIDTFGNKSLTTAEGVFIYDSIYLSTLQNSPVKISSDLGEITIENKIGAVGNLISYEQNNGEFTKEVFETNSSFPLINAKPGGIVRTKTRYLINKTDIDTLTTSSYLETKIP